MDIINFVCITGVLKMKAEYLVYMYALAILIYAGLKIFHIHLRVMDSFFIMFCGLCVAVSLASIVKIMVNNKE